MTKSFPGLPRKDQHLRICLERNVEFDRSAWFEDVSLIHCALAGCEPMEVDTSVTFLGRELSAPFLIGAMTGGTPDALAVNRDLAAVAEKLRIGMALGSQRAMLEDESLRRTYQVRDIAPDILLLGNIGLSTAGTLEPRRLMGLLDDIGADGICVYLNPAMALLQPGRGGPVKHAAETITRLVDTLGERLIVKETGCGISKEVAYALRKLGVSTVDVAGAGGTSWVRVNNIRYGSPPAELLPFEEWGIPTAASISEASASGLRIIASGGIRSGLDLAKAVALGAHMGSVALPVLRVLHADGTEGLQRWLESLFEVFRLALVLTGNRNVGGLRNSPVVLTGPLWAWSRQRIGDSSNGGCGAVGNPHRPGGSGCS